MYELVSGFGPVSPVNLHCLADMNDAELAELKEYWMLVPSRRRTQVAFGCLCMLRSSLALQFRAFFCFLAKDPVSHIREIAVEGMGLDVFSGALPYLELALSRDDSASVRLAVVQTLGQFLENGERGCWDEKVQVRVREILAHLIFNEDEALTLQCAALESLGFNPGRNFMLLLDEAYQSDLDEMRVSALIAMGRSRSLQWEEQILEAFDEQSGDMRAAAVRAGGLLRLESFLDISLNIVELETDGQMRLSAIEALGNLGGPTAYEGLLLAAESEDLEQREAVLKALEESEIDEALGA